ncbi:Cytochrome c-type protein NapC [hydrothermal vent metagenome]|uniref:Cytochrome c-type protein NapC n=1 Tax=hydrothermal vent metagenome TaxID=652676 RepID=A0A3B0U3A8_9ZZZZ
MSEPSKPKRRWLRRTLWGVPLFGGAIAFFAGIIFWGGFNTAMEATNTLGFCISCHEMEKTVFQEYKKTTHFQNRTGVRATCSDCHVPDPWVYKFVRKVKATAELYHKVLGTIDTKEKFEDRRLYLANRVWKNMKATDSRECRNCHNFESMSPEYQQPRARNQHKNAFENGQTCIDCHKGIAHKNVRDLLDDEEREALEAPVPALARTLPVHFTEGLARAKATEAEATARKEAEAAAAQAAVEARIAAAVAPLEDKVAQLTAQTQAQTQAAGQQAAAAGATGAADDLGALESAIDWSGVPVTTVTLFYPGQTSFEWMLSGRDHGGARPFTKAGDRCSTCHAQEIKKMGELIVSGEKAEATPIPGKRGYVDLRVQASYDDSDIHLRFQWPDTPHVPVPFTDGGKLDPDNQTKLSVMIAGASVEYAEQAGCWVSCHNDERYMPDAPDQAALDAFSHPALTDLANGITKYLAESRTKMEIKGRRGKKRGGWDKMKPEDEVAALAKSGAVMDLYRYRSGGAPENGAIVAERRMMDGDGPFEAAGKLEAGTWTVVMKRPLASTSPVDVGLDPANIYTVGFALHDDYSSARFHHVSLDLRLGFGKTDAEINAVRR